MDREQNSDINAADQIGEAAGGITGAVTGAALGSVAGPIGTLIGGIAGAVGGWWAGREIAEKASELAHEDDGDAMRPAYQLGRLAASNPDYAGREFDEIEADLRRGFPDQPDDPAGGWSTARGYAREGYDQGRASGER